MNVHGMGMEITSKRNEMGTDTTSERNVLGIDITDCTGDGHYVQVRGMYSGRTLQVMEYTEDGH